MGNAYSRTLTDVVSYGNTFTEVTLVSGVDFEALLFDNRGSYNVEVRINQGSENPFTIKLESGMYIDLLIQNLSKLEIRCSDTGHNSNVFYMLQGDKVIS